MKGFRERRIMLLMRAALFAAGGLIGALSMWQALDTMPYKFPVTAVVFCYIASALFLGGLLALSAAPLRTGFHNFSQSVRKRFRAVKAVDIAGVTVGLLLGLLAAFLSELLFGLFLKILALRILIDAIFGLLTAFIAAVAVSGWLGAESAEVKTETPVEIARGSKGYLLTEAALLNPKIIDLCGLWLEGNIYVLSKTADALAAKAENPDGSSAAYEHFKTLYRSKAVKILEFLSGADETEAYLDAAEAKRLKIITDGSDQRLAESKRGVLVLTLGEF